MEILSVTELRNQIYKVIDRVIETGIPQEIERSGHRLKIELNEPKKKKLDNLKPNNGIIGDPDDLAEYSVWKDEIEKKWDKKWDKMLKEPKK